MNEYFGPSIGCRTMQVRRSLVSSPAPVSAAWTASNKKRGRPLANSVVLKLDEVMRLRRWDKMCRDLSISNWLAMTATAKEVFMSSERTTCKVCLTTAMTNRQSCQTGFACEVT